MTQSIGNGDIMDPAIGSEPKPERIVYSRDSHNPKLPIDPKPSPQRKCKGSLLAGLSGATAMDD